MAVYYWKSFKKTFKVSLLPLSEPEQRCHSKFGLKVLNDAKFCVKDFEVASEEKNLKTSNLTKHTAAVNVKDYFRISKSPPVTCL